MSPTFRSPVSANTWLTATVSPWTSRRSPASDARGRASACPWRRGRRRATGASLGVGRLARGRSRSWRRGDAVDAVERAPLGRPAGIGAPSRPVSTNGAVTRAAVTRSASRCAAGLDDALRAREHRHEHDRGGERGGAPAVGGEAGGGEQAGRAEARAAARRAARRGSRAATRPSRPTPAASSIALEDRERDRPHALEEQRHRDAAAEAAARRRELQDAGAGVLDRRLAQRLGRAGAAGAAGGGEDRELRDQDAAAERRHERDPRVAGREARRDGVVVGEDVDDRVGQRPPASEAERAGDERDDQRLAGDQPPDLVRRGAERAQHRDLVAPLDDRQRERAGDDEQRDQRRRSRPSSRRSRPARRGRRRAGRSRRRRPRGRGRAPRARASPAGRGRPPARDRDRVDLARAAGEAGGDRVGEEQRRAGRPVARTVPVTR